MENLKIFFKRFSLLQHKGKLKNATYITPVLGAATAPGYLWRRFLHSEIRSPQAKLPAKTRESLFPRLFLSFVLYFYPKQIQSVKKKRKEKRKTLENLYPTQSTQGGEILSLNCKWPSLYVMWECQSDPIILRYSLPDRAVYNQRQCCHAPNHPQACFLWNFAHRESNRSEEGQRGNVFSSILALVL